MSDEKENKEQTTGKELSPEELKQMTGGVKKALVLDGIDGESTDDKHKGW